MSAPTPRIVAEGLRFPEGPSYLGDGAVAVVEMQGGSVARVAPDGAVTRHGGLGGGPNGGARGADGAVYVANNGGLSATPTGYWHADAPIDGCVQRVTADGAVTVVAGDLPGPAPHRPNDVCFGPDGRLYLSDSANWEDLRHLAPGRILAVGPGGAVAALAEVPALPNGVAFAPGGDRLFVAQSMTRKILAFPWSATGGLGEPNTFCKLPGGSPDGFCFDAEGNLYVCGSVGQAIYVYDSDGELRRTIATPPGSQPTNCCLGDGQLYVTWSMTGQLVAYDLGVAALPLHEGDLS
jgi:gluconolactonase